MPIFSACLTALSPDYTQVSGKTMQAIVFRENLKGKYSSDWRKHGYYRYWDHSKGPPWPILDGRGERYSLHLLLETDFQGNMNIPKEEPAREIMGILRLWKRTPRNFRNAYE